jgi:hypothetical protein
MQTAPNPYVPRVNSLLELDGLSVTDSQRMPHPSRLAQWEGFYEIDADKGVFRLTGAGLFERDPTVIAFRKAAGSASYHYADDSGKEWHLAKPYVAECQRLFDAAEDAVRAYLIRIKGDYMISLKFGDSRRASAGA